MERRRAKANATTCLKKHRQNLALIGVGLPEPDPRTRHETTSKEKTMARFEETPRVNIKQWNNYHMSVVFVIDTSGSMAGTPLDNAVAGINGFKSYLDKQPGCRDCVDVAVVAFDDTVRVVQDWVPVSEMGTILLDSGGCTDLAGGIKKGVELLRRRSKECAELGVLEKKPYMILLTDGYHNVGGGLDEAIDLADKRISDGKMKLFFLGYGEEYDKMTAAKLTRNQGKFCFEVTGPDAPFGDFFDFIGNSTKTASESSPDEKIYVETSIGTDESPVKITPLNAWLND